MGNSNSTDNNKNDDIFGQIKYPMVLVPEVDGYTQSFKIYQDIEYFKFFQEFGFVIIDNIIPPADIEKSILEIWDTVESIPGRKKKFFESEDRPERVDRNDSRTWNDDIFPKSPYGFFGDIALGDMAWKNRLNVDIYRIFSQLYDETELWVSLDRYGIMRPTQKIPIGKLSPPQTLRTNVCDNQDSTLEIKDCNHWKTQDTWLHWDLNPWVWTGSNVESLFQYSFDGNFIQENNDSSDGVNKFQGLINFVDSSVNGGGFCCVPAFHRCIQEWTELTRDSLYASRYAKSYSFVHVPRGDHIQEQVQKISLRAGSLLIWNGELPHANHPNNSQHFRMTQYIRYFPVTFQFGLDSGLRERRLMMDQYTQRLSLNDFHKKILGLEEW